MTSFEKLTEEVRKYIELRIQYHQIGSYERMAAIGSSLLSFMIVVSVLLFTLFILELTLAVILSDLLGSLTAGFGILLIVHLLICLLFLAFRKSLLKAPIYKWAVEQILDSFPNDTNDD